jgi:multicomponent Na+:H+ antiporter subunit C
VPIIDPSLHPSIRAIDYINPLPHVLMLTAIVVGVATTGIALTLLIIIYRKYGTVEEDEILEALKK